MRWKVFCTAILAGVVLMQIQAQNQQGRQNSVSYYEEMVGNLSNQMRLLQDENAKLASAIHQLQQEIRQLKQQVQNTQAESAQLRRMITEESASRQKQMGNIADRIQQAADAQAKADAASRAREAQTQRETNQTSSQEEYDYYVVESGATLSAISRATGVGIARLKKVNGMKNDILRVGQKLKIPRK